MKHRFGFDYSMLDDGVWCSCRRDLIFDHFDENILTHEKWHIHCIIKHDNLHSIKKQCEYRLNCPFEMRKSYFLIESYYVIHPGPTVCGILVIYVCVSL